MPDLHGMLNVDMSRRTSPVLIGRTQEMGALAAALTAVSQGDLTAPATILTGTRPGHTGAGPAAARIVSAHRGGRIA